MTNLSQNIKPITIFIMVTLTLLIAEIVQADIYHWVDENGRVQISDRAPNNIEAKVIKKSSSKKKASTNKVSEKLKNKNSQKQKVSDVKVILYSTTWCGYCKKARQYFQDNNIKFEEYDTENSARGKRDYKKLKGKSVPIILVNKYRINGFSAKNFQKTYAYAQKQ